MTALLLLPLLLSSACPPTGSYIGVVLEESWDPSEIVRALESLGIESRVEEVEIAPGQLVSTVVFYLGYWLPAGPMTPERIPASVRLYVGNRFTAVLANTTLSGSPIPLRDEGGHLHFFHEICQLCKYRQSL